MNLVKYFGFEPTYKHYWYEDDVEYGRPVEFYSQVHNSSITVDAHGDEDALVQLELTLKAGLLKAIQLGLKLG